MIHLFKTEKEWLAYKRKKSPISGTGISTILGSNDYETPIQLYRVIKGIDPPAEMNDNMQRGQDFEPIILNDFKRTYGGVSKWVKDGVIPFLTHPDYEFLGSSPDDYVVDTTKDGNVLVEAKSKLGYVYDIDDANPNWIHQLNWNMGIAMLNGLDVTKGVLSVICSTLNPTHWFYDFNQELFDAQIEGGLAFKAMLDNDIVPNPRDHDDFNLIQTFPKPIHSTPLVMSQLRKLGQVKDSLAKLKREEDFLVIQLKRYMGEHESLIEGSTEGKPTKLVSFKSMTQTRFDKNKFKKEHPELYKDYIFTATFRQFRPTYTNFYGKIARQKPKSRRAKIERKKGGKK